MKTFNIKYSGSKSLKTFIDQKKIAEEKNILLQIFTGVCDLDFITDLVKTITTYIPHINIIGTTTSGEIYEDSAYDNSTILSFSLFENTSILTCFTQIDQNSYITAQKIISQLDTKRVPKVAISFVDGLHVNGEEYLNAFHDYDKEIIVAGGLAGDNANFVNTIVFTQEKILLDGAVVAFLFNDDLRVSTQASFGWKNIGKIMKITKAIGNVVYEIDGIKAVDIYAKYLGDDIATELPKTGIEFPLIVKKKKLNIPRAVVGRNEDDSLVFAGNLHVGDTVTFGYGNIEAILSYGKGIYSKEAVLKSESIFIYSCMARKALLQDTIKAELAPLSSITSVSGFFTYGEFFSSSSQQELLNQTMTILALSENCSKIDEKLPKETQKNKAYFKERRKHDLTLQALSHLVSQTSTELEEINNSLQNRVEEAVEKSRLQDQQLIDQSRLAQMGEMMSMIAHQWRQPLAAISSLSTGINLKTTLGTIDDETLLSLSSDITSHTKHLSETIDDFREFFRPNKERRESNFNEIIQGVLSIVEDSITNKNITIIKELKSDNSFSTYPNEIKQVVLNLLKNAEDALLEHEIKDSYIKIKSYNKGKYSILEVSDNAGGISKNVIDKIFDPYFSTKTKKDGTGLGLYMSKTIIEEHCGGLLHVSNDDKGAVFKIEIS